jgi:hypothetical protein
VNGLVVNITAAHARPVLLTRWCQQACAGCATPGATRYGGITPDVMAFEMPN